MHETPLDPDKTDLSTHERTSCWKNDNAGRQVAITRNNGNAKSSGDEARDAARIITFKTNNRNKTSGAAELVRKSSNDVTGLKCHNRLARQIAQPNKLLTRQRMCPLSNQHEFLIGYPFPRK